MKKHSIWQHKQFPRSFRLAVERVTAFDIVDGAARKDRFLEGPFADVIFENGKRSTMRCETIKQLFEEVA